MTGSQFRKEAIHARAVHGAPRERVLEPCDGTIMGFHPPFEVWHLTGVALVPVANSEVDCGFLIHRCSPVDSVQCSGHDGRWCQLQMRKGAQWVSSWQFQA